MKEANSSSTTSVVQHTPGWCDAISVPESPSHTCLLVERNDEANQSIQGFEQRVVGKHPQAPTAGLLNTSSSSNLVFLSHLPSK